MFRPAPFSRENISLSMGFVRSGIDFDMAPLPSRKTAKVPEWGEVARNSLSLCYQSPSSRLVSPSATKQGQEDPCAKLFRGPKVKTTVCFYDAPLDIRVELFRLIRCDENTDILGKAIAIGSRRWDMDVHWKPI